MVNRWGAVVLVAAVVAASFGLVPAVPAAQAPGAEPNAVVAAADSNRLLYVTEGNRLRRIDVDTIGTDTLVEDVLIERAASDPEGRDINGQMCELPGTGGRFVAGEDTGQPDPPAGWGVFEGDGTQVGKLTASYFEEGAEPHGCAVAPDGSLFTAEVGFQGFGTNNGQLIQWFPPYDGYPGPAGAYPATNERSTNFCKLATDLGTAGGVAVDAQGRVYVAQSSGLRIDRFSPPFPTGPDAAGGCGGIDSTGAPIATSVTREQFAAPGEGMLTFSGVAIAPNGNVYASSVLTGRIAEYDLDGNFVRLILAPEETVPPIPTGHPQDLVVDADGTIYYADLDLQGTLPAVGPGPNGKIWRIRFDSDGDPRPPDLVRQGLAFPDGVALFSGNLQAETQGPLEWPTLAGGPKRRFFNPNEQWLTPASAPKLIERWRFDTDGVVTSSPSVATVETAPGEQRRVVFVSSWDRHLYALDWATGEQRWSFEWEDQPGASFPGAGSATVADVDGERLVIFGAGEYVYALDARTGAERWRFAAGTGCRDPQTGTFPGLCSFSGERNQVESTPIVHQGVVYFGMDVNDVATGKGGFYALDAARGTLRWFFDPESGTVCRPDLDDEQGTGDEIRRFDGYHSEAELGLPEGFFSTRNGCNHPRTRYGCGNVWSSPALDAERGLLFFGTSNCDTDDNPATSTPPPPMPQYDEALVALRLDGSPAWRWRPREVDNDDLAFGAAPNLFTIEVDDRPRDVVGIGGKDGTYYVVDRTGVNARSALRWDDPNPRALPYWERNVVPGGEIGGIIATASVDEAARRVFFSTAPGEDVISPQRPTVHALDLDTGSVVWQHDATGLAGDASYGPTSAVPGVVVVGSVITPHLRFFDSATGALVADHPIRAQNTLSGVSSGATILDGTVVVGAGIGSRSSGGSSPGDFAANTPSSIVALCVPGSPGCLKPVLTPGTASVQEGNKGSVTVRVPVELSEPSTESVSVDWTTWDTAVRSDLAKPPDDYASASGTVVLAPGETVGHATIQVRGDKLHEGDELIPLVFGNPRNARIGGFYGLAVATIIDDDPPPVVRIKPRTIRESDADQVVDVDVRLSAPSGRSASVVWRTEAGTANDGSDFVGATGSVVFAPGETRAVIPVTVRGDRSRERVERFVVSLEGPTGATIGRGGDRASVVVLDDD